MIVLNPVADQTMSAVLSAPLPSPTHIAFRLDIRPRGDEHLGDLRRLIVSR